MTTIGTTPHRPRHRVARSMIVAVFALLIAATPATAAGVWTAKADVPSAGSGVEGMSVGVTDGYIVAAYGLDPGLGDTNLTRVYSMPTNTWSLGSPAPLPVRSEGIGILRDGKLYSIGGRSGAGVIKDLDRYHKNTDTWISLADMPTARAGLGGAVSGRYIYAIGGRTSTAPCFGGELDTVERYDTMTDTWSTLAPLPSPRSDLGALAMGNGKIYVFGGCASAFVVIDDVDVYDINTNTWSTAPADLPTARAAFYQVGFAGPKIYVMGGMDSGFLVSPLNEVYNITNNTWSIDTPMTTPRGEMGVGSVGGTIWTVGGAVPAFGISENALETFRP
jgi:N-acetylneuraminic acid mutarotase